MSDQWIAFITLGAGIAVQIGLLLKIDNRMKHLESAVVRIDTKVEERTSPKKLVLADEVGT